VLRLFLITIAVVACASRRPQELPRADRSSDPRVEIETLDQQIHDMLLQRYEIKPFIAKCAADQSCTDEVPPPPVCGSSTPSCSASCEIGVSICKNAARICELAKQLGGQDRYANEKCQHGNESCAAACSRCTSCRP
jgi:hypothetical protein